MHRRSAAEHVLLAVVCRCDTRVCCTSTEWGVILSRPVVVEPRPSRVSRLPAAAHGPPATTGDAAETSTDKGAAGGRRRRGSGEKGFFERRCRARSFHFYSRPPRCLRELRRILRPRNPYRRLCRSIITLRLPRGHTVLPPSRHFTVGLVATVYTAPTPKRTHAERKTSGGKAAAPLGNVRDPRGSCSYSYRIVARRSPVGVTSLSPLLPPLDVSVYPTGWARSLFSRAPDVATTTIS